jgi:hypothetical protein
MSIDDFLFRILNEYDGFKYKSSHKEDYLRKIMAEYALACLHDTKLAQEAMKICEGN